MARKSSITFLAPPIKAEVDRLIREGRYTIDDIVAHLRGLGVPRDEISRSAVGRYKQKAEKQMERWKEAQELAATWSKKWEDDPDGDVSQLLGQMLRSVAYQVMADLGDREEVADAGEVMFLAKALKDLAHSEKLRADVAIIVRRELRKLTEQKLDEIEKEKASDGQRRFDPDTLRRVREEIYGIYDT